MASQSRSFPYEKTIVINALYDSIDALGLCLDSANSARGTLIVSHAGHSGSLRIALDTGGHINQTQIKVFADDSNTGFAEAWGLVVLDEAAARMKRVYQREGGETTK